MGQCRRRRLAIGRSLSETDDSAPLALKDKLADVKQSRDHWETRAGRLALMVPTVIAAPGLLRRRR